MPNISAITTIATNEIIIIILVVQIVGVLFSILMSFKSLFHYLKFPAARLFDNYLCYFHFLDFPLMK